MQKHIDKMMTGGIYSEHAPVQSMRNHGQRMPVPGHNCRKGPLNIFRIYTGLNMLVSNNVPTIIKRNKRIIRNPAKGNAGNDD